MHRQVHFDRQKARRTLMRMFGPQAVVNTHEDILRGDRQVWVTIPAGPGVAEERYEATADRWADAVEDIKHQVRLRGVGADDAREGAREEASA